MLNTHPVQIVNVALAAIMFLAPRAEALPASSAPAQDLGLIQLDEGFHVVLMGNGLGSRMLHFGHFETGLHLRYPSERLFVRNICDEGNTPSFRPHSGRSNQLGFPGAESFHGPYSDNNTANGSGHFETEEQWLGRLKPNVLIAFFGFNESFQGGAGIANFRAELDAFVVHTMGQSYGADQPPQLVLVSPTAFEDRSDVMSVSDGGRENANLAAYTSVMEAVAAARGVRFVNAFSASLSWIEDSRKPLTTDGALLNDTGYSLFSQFLLDSIFEAEDTVPREAAVRAAVVDKNWLWINDFKIPNGVHAFGRRYDPFGPDNYPYEIDKIREMTVIRDEAIDIRLAPKAIALLRKEQRRAISTGRIVRTEESLVPATIVHDGKELAAEVRLKGDLIDHVNTERWSLRVELEDEPLFGMSRLSIQHPKTRKYLPGYLVLEAARSRGLIAPRASFVNVEINGKPNGIYELEEHISKELLEGQGRRDGPIVNLNESTSWSLAAQMKTVTPRQEPSRRIPGNHVLNAEVTAFGEKHLASSENLSRQMQSALTKMRDLQRLMILRSRWSDFLAELPFNTKSARLIENERFVLDLHAGGSTADLPVQLQAASELVAESVGEIFAVKRMAKATALLSLFGGSHGLAWHNTRFYLDPTRDRLELVLFDIDPSITHGWTVDPFVWDQHWIGNILKDRPDYYLEVFRELHELTSPETSRATTLPSGPRETSPWERTSPRSEPTSRTGRTS